MNQEDLEYERKYSHSHCWNQGKNPACGQPLENHKQCCLCDTVYKPRKRFPSQPNSEDGKMMYGHSSGNEVQFSHSPKPEEKCPLGKGHKYSEICRVCTPLPDTTEEKIGIGDKLPSCECSSILEMMKGERKVCEIHNDTSNEWEINWKAVLTDKLFDAQVNPKTIVRLISSFESVLNHLLSQSEQRVRKEMVELLGNAYLCRIY